MIQLPESLSDHPSLVSIVRFPDCNFETTELKINVVRKIEGNWCNEATTVDSATTITSKSKTSVAYSIPKSKYTDFYPYTYYCLTDGETEPLVLFPQYLNSTLTIKGEFALSSSPVERYYPSYYKGATDGVLYNITNTNQMLLPTATNEGAAYYNANANYIEKSRSNMITGNILNGIGTVAAAVATNGVSLLMGGVAQTVNGINAVKEADARNKDMLLTPSSCNNIGSPSTRQAFNTDKVRLIKYTIKDNVKNKINSYIDRYGSKYNNYDTIDLKRYKGFIKYINPDIDGSIDNIYLNKIIDILERGVFVE